ncbi:DUF6428 family protein [Tropicimonas sp. S265A]|uniref:DUF6428 family protein n=1 Tax=Tropicimonas sp. S265A TaxID=3415134 RepID=UPI003C7B14AD
MPPAPATLTDLIADLSAQDPEAAAVFQLDGRDIQAGYHVTELKLARIDGIDCGGRRSHWQEAQMQVLDGYGGKWMRAGKLAGILRQSAEALPGLADAPLSVEFAPGNAHLARYHLGPLGTDAEGRLTLPLVATRAVCKPAEDHALRVGGARCC